MASLPSAPTASEARAARRIVILGAAGRDFHNFNTVWRDDPSARVVAFTAAQIPGIADRRYPPALAGPLYPEGIPIVAEERLEELCRAEPVDAVVFAYSDVPHERVMHLASRALALGADFLLLGPARTALRANRPVIAVSALRTGCGKSAVARFIAERLRQRGRRVAVLRHPMPYGDLARERVQRFASLVDLDRAGCTVEEREEYEPHIAMGHVVFAGVDYQAILAAAEREAEIIVWDGGNNDFPFLRPDLHIALADALRPTQVATHHPGEAVARMADVLLINKVDAAPPGDVAALAARCRAINPRAVILRGASPVRLDRAELARHRRVLVVEDGPTLTHGGMSYGAGLIAARAAGAAEIVDPRLSAPPEIAALFAAYPQIGKVLPALGYDAAQLRAIETTVNRAAADVVIAATPVDLGRLIRAEKPILRARYDFAEAGEPGLGALIDGFLDARSGGGREFAPAAAPP